jgi:hypothetical protein
MICGRSVMDAVPSQPIAATPAMTSAAAAGLSACFMGMTARFRRCSRCDTIPSQIVVHRWLGRRRNGGSGSARAARRSPGRHASAP